MTYLVWPEAELKRSFVEEAKAFFLLQFFKVLETKIEDDYDMDEEIEKHLQADLVILQTPVNWIKHALDL